MAKQSGIPAFDANLRRRAEHRLRQMRPMPGTNEAWPSNQEDGRKLVHEIQVLQIELELQNEDLAEARTQTEAALARYTDLYDFAPIGYFTLDPAGVILEVSLTGARLLGLPRSEVTGRRFALFVTSWSTEAFDAFLSRLFGNGAHGPFEATLELVADTPKHVRMEAIASENGQTCRAMVTDITQRQLAEQALRKFSRVIEQTASSIVITDADGIIEYANPRFLETSGYAADEVIGRQASLLKSGQISEAEYRDLWHTIKGGSVWRGRFCNRRKDGSLYWESAIISPIRDERGKVTHFVGINDDITARVEAEQALRDSEARFRRLFDLAPVPLCHVGRNGAVIDVNQRFVETFGYTHEQVPTVNAWWRLAYPDPEYRQQVVSTWEAAVDLATRAGTDIEPKEYWVTCMSGNIRTLVISGSLVGDNIIVTFFDVTERKQAELDLAEREARHQAAIGTATDGFWMVDAAGHILEVNDAYVRRSGYSREALMAMSIAQLDVQEAPEDVRTHMEMIRRQGNELFETLHRTRDGDVWPVEVNAAYWASAGGRYFVFLRDLTERKRSEVAMQSLRVEMERLMRAHVARQTVAALAHELNQPLSAVTNYTEAALRLLHADKPSLDRLQHALENSTLQAQRAGRVVRDLLALLHRGGIETQAVDLNSVVRNALALVKADGHSDFRAVLELAPELSPVRANRLQVEKVLVNLVQNGIEAMRDAGVDSRLITITVRTASDARMAHVTVCDSGPGLDEQTLQRIFDPFFTTKASGLGMGLPISRAIVEAHGGRLWVEPILGAGISVHFTLPFSE